MNVQTHNTNVEREKNWVLYGWGGTLSYLPTKLGIQHQLRKAARRMRRQVITDQQQSGIFVAPDSGNPNRIY